MQRIGLDAKGSRVMRRFRQEVGRSPGAAARWLAAVAGLAGLAGCGHGEDPAPGAGACDPLAQDGCDVGEKCSVRVDSEVPYMTTVTCVPNGNAPVGGLCGFGEPGERGYDTCQAGSFCLEGVCTPVCAPGAGGCAGETCIEYGGIFEGDGLGLCTPLCEPVAAEGCALEQGCYLRLDTGLATCHGAGDLGQGEACAYIDACERGLGCVLLAPDQQSTVCAAFCDPTTGVTASGGSCAEALGPDAGAPACAAIGAFYQDAPEVPAGVGMCLDCGIAEYAGLSVCGGAGAVAGSGAGLAR